MAEWGLDADEHIWGALATRSDQLADGQPLHVQD
jgi:hypothetical protein